MTKYEEIYLISNLLSKANSDDSVDLSNSKIWESIFLTVETNIGDSLYHLDEKGIINFEEIGEDGFKPILMCSIKPETTEYLKKLTLEIESENLKDKQEITSLNKRITEILTFDPKRLSDEINSTEKIISDTKKQLKSNSVLQPMTKQLEEIEVHFKSLSKVARNYEEVYKNIILPVREEGKSGVRQTVKWAIISVVASTLLSVIISWWIK
jgi:hypothetical protein